jgi:hypothetical protein
VVCNATIVLVAVIRVRPYFSPQAHGFYARVIVVKQTYVCSFSSVLWTYVRVFRCVALFDGTLMACYCHGVRKLRTYHFFIVIVCVVVAVFCVSSASRLSSVPGKVRHYLCACVIDTPPSFEDFHRLSAIFLLYLHRGVDRVLPSSVDVKWAIRCLVLSVYFLYYFVSLCILLL